MGSDKTKAKPDLYAALAEAQRSIGEIPKDAENTFDGYSYTSADTLIAAARSALLDNGLLVRRMAWTITPGELFDNDRVRMLESRFELVQIATGETLQADVPFPIIVPEKRGSQWDRSLSSSLTSSLAYWLRDLLMIPRSDAQLDVGRRDDEKPAKPRKRTPKRDDPDLDAAFVDLLDALRRARPEESRSDDEIRTSISAHLLKDRKPVTARTVRELIDRVVQAATPETASQDVSADEPAPPPSPDATLETASAHVREGFGVSPDMTLKKIDEIRTAIGSSKWAQGSMLLLQASAGGIDPPGDPFEFLAVSGCDLTTKDGRDWLRDQLRDGIRWDELETYAE